MVEKVRRIVTFLQDMEREDEIRAVPSWKARLLTGDRKGTWSLFVTKNWRLTFRIDQAEIVFQVAGTNIRLLPIERFKLQIDRR